MRILPPELDALAQCGIRRHLQSAVSGALLISLLAVSPALSQIHVVDIHVGPTQSGSQGVLLIGSLKAIRIDSAQGLARTAKGVEGLDSLFLQTPFSFSVDLKLGPVLLVSLTKDWIAADVLLNGGGTINATAERLQVSLVRNRVLVRGVPPDGQ